MHSAYKEIDITTDVMTASAHRLIQLLLNRCLEHMQTTKKQIEANLLREKCASISKATDILEYLRLCLNMEDAKAKTISVTLDQLYTYIEKLLLLANLQNDTTHIDEAMKLLRNIKEGWDGAGEKLEGK
ncbi:MAG: flagellar export chaperone FliS [Gammaproteobacteria bacterium]